jgi:outer membrane murein-binding lipoprotein Lpp
MKTTILHRFAIIAAITGTILTGCKKDNNNTASQTDTDLNTQSDDQARVSNETDAVSDDVNASLSASGTIAGSSITPGVRYGVTTDGGGPDTLKQASICDAVVVADTVSNPHTLTITYNGTNCSGNRTRTGVVVISIPAGQQWKNQGATVSVSIQNLKITRISDKKSITFNGTHLYTNVSGGSLTQLYLGTVSSITHTVSSSNMSITFDNGMQRTWSIARQRVFTFSNSVAKVTETGFHTDGTTQAISEWGTNRFGNTFTTVISQPLVISSGCNFQLISGQAQLTNAAGMTTITFGLDATGAATGCPVVGAYYYFKLVWAGNGGKVYTFILPY